MVDDRRLTTDRFYGGTSQRLQLLQDFLVVLENGETKRAEVKDWILGNTRAQSRDAIDHHLGFLDATELIDLDGDEVSIDWRGRQYLESPESSVLYDALRANVKGFDSILAQLREGPMTDEDIMRHLKNEFEDVEMDSPGVATRHREWLQVLGYVDRNGNSNSLTGKGRELVSEVAADENNDHDRVQRLRRRLLETEMACVPAGQQDLTEDIYPAVKAEYPDLCDDSYRCEDAHENGRDLPEWQHAVRDIQQRLADREEGRIRRVDKRGKWLFLPRFEVGETYKRSDLHDQYGGKRQSGIAPSAKFPLVLLFTTDSGGDYGYEDEFHADGTVICTGEGREGRMTYDHGNRAVGDHKEERRELHLFEDAGNGFVQYKGQYECVDWFREDIPDVNGDVRSGIRFELQPVSDTVHEGQDVGHEGASTGNSSQQTEDESGGLETVTELPSGSETTQRREAVREEVVRDEALVRDIKSMYDDRCQICGEKRLQGPENGYSEVHHLMPLGDGGPDIPENVVVVCPNHHIDFENGVLAINPQTLEINHQYESEVDGRELLLEEGHDVGREYIAYHNQVIAYTESEIDP